MSDILFDVKNISKKFSGTDVYALQNINLEIANDSCVIIAGENGSGKTVLTKIITALIEPSEGEVFFCGQPLFGKNAKRETLNKLRKSTGLVFQDADCQIIGQTVYEDISFGLENLKVPQNEIDKRVRGMIALFALQGKEDSPPRTLSGGEKRKLAIASILVTGSDTVILDEPFANLDYPGVVDVLSAIRTLRSEHKTVIVLTHELEKVLAFGDTLVVMHSGVIADIGSPPEVLSRLKKEYGVRDPRGNYQNVEDCTWL
jgi:biotin transport system ATP-binding protein